MRRFVPAALLVALTAGLCAADEWSRSFPVSGAPAIRIKVNDGHIKVTPGASSAVQVTVTGRGYENGRDYRVRPSQSGNRVEVEVEVLPQGQQRWGFSGRSIEVSVSAPARSNLDLDSGDGHVSVEGINGAAKIRTRDGHITVRRLEGSVEARTGDGHITAESMKGSLDARTKDGHISASGRFDALEAETGDGHVDLRVEQGSVMRTHWNVRTGDGRISLTLPADLAADLDVSTSDGRIRSDFAGTISGRHEQDRSSLRAKLNGGGNMLSVRTGGGEITIRKR